jgi:aspartate aminotransferase
MLNGGLNHAQEPPVIQPSRRILNVKSSPTVALNAKAKALAKEGAKVLNFTVGEPDFPTPAPVVEKAIAALQAGRTKYGPAGGSPEFREAIAAKLRRENNLQFPAEDIVCGVGAKELLFHIFLALLNDGDEVLVPSPYWVSYPDQILAAGGKPVFLPVSENMGEAPIKIADIERLATPRTVGIILNSPNNPAGYMFSEALSHELGQYLSHKPWWIVSDEIYEYMAFDRQHVSLLALFPELKDRFIHVNGMSKGYAMTGWRVGYCAGPKAIMKIVRDLQSHSSTCLPPFIEEAATFAISQGPGLLEKEIANLRHRRDLAASLAAQIPGVSFAAPQGAFYLFLNVSEALGQAKQKIDTFTLAEQLLMKHHMALVPGDAFGAPGYLRLSYATSEATITEGMSRLAAALKEL